MSFRLLAMKTSTNLQAVPKAVWASSLKIRVKIEIQVQFSERLTCQVSLCHVIWFSRVCFSLAFTVEYLKSSLEFLLHHGKPKFISLPLSPRQIKVSFGLIRVHCKCLKADQSVLPWAWFPHDRPDRLDHPSHLKKCSDNCRRLRRLRWLKAIPEVITFIPVIENKFGPDGAEAEKIIHKINVRSAFGSYLKLQKVCDMKFLKRYYVFGELF